MLDASVIIPARDSAVHLARALAALERQQTARDWEVIVVDDGSTDDTASVAERASARVRVVHGTGRGPAAARNVGAAQARGRVLAFTDADCEPAPGWLESGLKAIDAGAAIVQGRVIATPGVPIGPFDRTIWVESAYGLYETANLLIKRELFERLGGFESILQPRSGKELGEDVWLGWRARRAGVTPVFERGALVHHAVLPRGRRGYVAERTRLYFFPELVKRIPELRQEFAYHRWFLNARTARVDLLALGALAALVAHHPAPLVAGLPYLLAVARHGRADDSGRPFMVATVEVVADLVGAGALVLGSLRSRSLLI